MYEVSSLRRTPDFALPHIQRPPHLRRGLQGLRMMISKQKLKTLSSGGWAGKMFGSKWEKWEVAQLSSAAQSEVQAKKVMGSIFALYRWIYANGNLWLCTGMVSLSRTACSRCHTSLVSANQTVLVGRTKTYFWLHCQKFHPIYYFLIQTKCLQWNWPRSVFYITEAIWSA